MSVRPATTQDLEQILAIYAPYITSTSYSFEYTVPTLEEFTHRFETITAQFPWIVWEQDGEILGYAYGSAPFERAAYRWCAEVSIYLRPDAHRRGIGKSLYAVLEEILRLQGYRTAYALITATNTGSMAFHEKLGYRSCAKFSLCGYKFGMWQDVIWLEKVLQTVDSPMNFPCPAEDIVKNHRNLTKILDTLSLS